uniref:Transactivator/viroplasmin protein n=1 Tax=Hibiscus soymovirus TaxID=3023608 RepID=A0AAF1BW69_9VIRU|nr:transactivation protein [Hibiscus soymovirus]
MESLRPMIEAKIAELEQEVQNHKEEARRQQKLASEKEKELATLRSLFEKKEEKIQEKIQEKEKEKIQEKEKEKIQEIKDAKKDKEYEKNQHTQAQANICVSSAGTDSFDEEERSRTHYVIFTGSNRGIYDDWSKAAIFITGQNVIHKSYPSLHEAKKALQEFKQKESYKAKVQTSEQEAAQLRRQNESIRKMVVLGKTRALTIDSISTKKELEEKVKLTNNIFNQEFKFLMEYSDEDKATSIYPVGSNYQGPKAVALPEADPIKTYMMFQSGLLSAIYFESLDIFKYFPSKIRMTIQQYSQRILKGKQGFLRIFATFPEFLEGGEVIQPAVQLIQIGQSNKSYPVLSEVEQGDVLEFLLNNYVLILNKGIKVNGRINYAARSIIIWSLQAKPIQQSDRDILNKFLDQTIRVEYSFSQEIKKEICYRLTQEFKEDHICSMCEPAGSPQSPIIEEDSGDKM